MTPRVLIFTPTYGGLLRPEMLESVAAQRFDGELPHVISEENPYPGRDMRNVLHQFNIGREMALAGGYDALLTVEHDMRLPADAAALLWAVDAPVVYGVYMLRHGTNVLNAWRWEGWVNLGMSLSKHPQDLAQARAAQVVRVSGVGFGCTLIRREVLEAIPFRGTEGSGPDLAFAVDCLRSNWVAMAHFGVACEHYHEGLWLTMEDDEAVTVEFLPSQSLTANVYGESVPLVAGVGVGLPGLVAIELQRAGFGKIVRREERTETAVLPAGETRGRQKVKGEGKRGGGDVA